MVRREAGAPKKRLPPELEALARSEDGRLRPARPRRPRLKDPRATALVPGVANRDARLVYDTRLEPLKMAAEAWRTDPDTGTDRLATLLAEAVLLGVWRGRSVTGFDAFAENVLGVAPDEARTLAERGADALGVPCEPCTDEAIAIWMRAESALTDAGLKGRVTIVREGDEETLRVELPLGPAPQALVAVGQRMTPLARDRTERR